MVESSVVVVYGVPGGLGTPSTKGSRRLGVGRLQLPTLVTLDRQLELRMASVRPPRLLRVGIGWIQFGRARVEVIEILTVHTAESPGVGTPLFGVELAAAAVAPTEADASAADHPHSVPASLWCRMFPRARFCR